MKMRMVRMLELGGTLQIITAVAAPLGTLLKQGSCNTTAHRQNTLARDKDGSKAQINQRKAQEKEEEEEEKAKEKKDVLSDITPEQAGITQDP
jgi:hypothetical protein